MKTQTLVDTDNPVLSLLPGHKGARDFNKAWRAEGWGRGGWVYRNELKHEFWIPLKNGSWKRSNEDNPKAKPVTVMYW